MTSIDLACDGLDAEQGIDIIVMGHVVLDPAGNTFVKLVPKGCIAPIGENRELIKSDDVGSDLIGGFHLADANRIFRVTDGIVGAKIILKLLDETEEISVPNRN